LVNIFNRNFKFYLITKNLQYKKIELLKSKRTPAETEEI